MIVNALLANEVGALQIKSDFEDETASYRKVILVIIRLVMVRNLDS